jgi:DNA-binding NtrC family response regulator
LVMGKWLVAIVDDELDIASLFREYLSGIKDVLVFSFTDPVVALEHFINNKREYFLIISDLKMPRLSGIELIKKVKEANPFVRTLLMTAFEIDDPMFEEYRKANIINDFLQKPVRLEDLHSIVEKHLNLYKKFKKEL